MKKKEIIVVFAIIIVGLIIAFILNYALTYGHMIETIISKDAWLNFWGSYCGGLFAVAVGYLVIIHSNRNNEKAINQQYVLLKHQQNEKKLDGYNLCLRNNLELMNAVEAFRPAISMNYDNLSVTKSEIAKKKYPTLAEALIFLVCCISCNGSCFALCAGRECRCLKV